MFNTECKSNDRAMKSISSAQVEDSLEYDGSNERNNLNTSFENSFYVDISFQLPEGSIGFKTD